MTEETKAASAANVPPAGSTPPAATERPQTSGPSTATSKARNNDLMRGKPPVEPKDAPQYRVTKKPHFINGIVVQPGELVRYAGIPGVLLEPLDEGAVKARSEADAARAKRVRQEEEKRANARKLIKALANA